MGAKSRIISTPGGGTIELRLPTAPSACEVAIRYIEKGLVDPAVVELEKVLASNPEDGEAHGLLGSVRLAQEHYDEAVTELEAACRVDPDHAFWRYKLGVAFEWQGDLGEARRHLEHALGIDPLHGDTHAELGQVLHTLGHTGEALMAWETAVAQHTRVAEAYCNLGGHYVNEGRAEEAVPLLEKAVELGTPEVQGAAHFGLAVAFSALGRDGRAVGEELAKAANLGNEQAIALAQR